MIQVRLKGKYIPKNVNEIMYIEITTWSKTTLAYEGKVHYWDANPPDTCEF